VNLSLHPSKYIALCEGRYAAAHGRCKSFGNDGNGYVPGEGVGAVLLKPLSCALADGDRVRAVIRGTAVNHGGRQNRFSVPSPTAQAALIARALERARVAPEAVGYVEAHGTGTRLGDPIEIRGLADAFARRGGRIAPCPVGSVKSNIGHLEAAAGIAGLTKVLLQMKHGELVPSLHCDVENAEVGFERTPFFVQKKVAPWPLPARDGAGARIATVSAFGAGGSNAHVVVEQWMDPDPREPAAEGAAPEAFVFSARTVSSLERHLRRMLAFLQRTRVDLADAAYTLAVGRDARESRIAFLARSQEELVAAVERALEAGVTAEQLRSRVAAAGAEAGTPCRHPRFGVDLAPAVARWLAGERVDWASIYARDSVRRRRIPLPTYCFDRERYWIV